MRGPGCGSCAFVRTSRAELRLKAEISLFFDVEAEPNKARVDGGRTEDVYIADIARMLVIEFDGAYFHGRPAAWTRDTEKTQRLRASGWIVVRVREHPLERIDEVNDVAVPKDAHPYLVASVVIRHLAVLGLIPAPAADNYCDAGGLQAEDLSSRWIGDRLGTLMSKAERVTLAQKWDRMHAALVSFQARFGTCQVPEGILVKGIDLRTWCYSQRALHRKGQLTADRQDRLAAIPTWHFDVRSAAFQDGYEHYRRVTQAEAAGTDAQDFADARQWAKKLRERRAKLLGHGEDLPRDQLDAMDSLAGWRWTPRETRFDEQLDILRAYHADTGQPISAVKAKQTWNGHCVGSWISNWKSRRPRLTEHQVSSLEALPGWTWSKHNAAWEAGFDALLAFGREHGHISPSESDPLPEVQRLARWKQKNRSRLRGKKTERAVRLRTLLASYNETLG